MVALATLAHASMSPHARPVGPQPRLSKAAILPCLLAASAIAWAIPATSANAATSQGPHVGPAAEEPPVIIGVNGGTGWGMADPAHLQEYGLTSTRFEAGEGQPLSELARDGWKDDLVIVGNTPDEDALSTVDIPTWTREALAQVKEAAGDGETLLEVGNEMYLKGNFCAGCGRTIEPVKYAEMFIALSRAVEAAHITSVKLLFDSYGDYQAVEGGPWSQIWTGGGWLAAAAHAEPELLSRVDGFTMHPYGRAGENRSNDSGPVALSVQHEQAVSLGFQHTDFYATEFGVPVEGLPDPSSLALQAEVIESVYDELISYGFVKGIWYYQVHDDSTGQWGLIERQENGRSPFLPRPSLRVLSELAQRFENPSTATAPLGLTNSGSGATASLNLGGSDVIYYPNLKLSLPPWSNGPYD